MLIDGHSILIYLQVIGILFIIGLCYSINEFTYWFLQGESK